MSTQYDTNNRSGTPQRGELGATSPPREPAGPGLPPGTKSESGPEPSRPPTEEDARQPQQLFSAATVVEWEDQFTRWGHRPVETPDELRGFLASCCAGAVSSRATALAVGGSGGSGRKNPLVILRGLAPAFVSTLLETAALGIDPAFIAAHASRSRYKPARRRLVEDPGRRRAYAQWGYPELVCGLNDAVLRGQAGSLLADARGHSLVRGVSDEEDLAAVECRASVWVGDKVDILLLDRPAWEERGGLLTKVRSPSVVGLVVMVGEEEEEEAAEPRWDVSAGDEEALPCLEDTLQEALSAAAEAEAGVAELLERAAYDKWLDLFDVLTPRQQPMILDGTSLEWRALQALERNADMARSRGRATTVPSSPDWPALVQRLRDRISLLPTIPPKPAAPTDNEKTRRRAADTEPSPAETNLVMRPPPRPAPTTPPSPGGSGGNGGNGDDANQRGLDRVTYLGGLVLPTSLVASILSMNMDFAPGQPLFWVFWAAAAPLTLLTLVVIYADKLRQVEVWVEDGAPRVGGPTRPLRPETKTAGGAYGQGEHGGYDGDGDGDGDGDYDDEEEEKEDASATGGGILRHGKQHCAETQAPQGVSAYAAAEDVVVDLSGALTQEQPSGASAAGPARPSSQQQPLNEAGADAVPHHDTHAYAAPTWRKKQLGWGGAAMAILNMRKPPLRVEDGLPPAARR